MEKKITAEQFKDKYNKLKTIKDGIDFVENLELDLLIKLRGSLEVNKEYFNLDMREDFMFGLIKSEINRRKNEKI